MRLIFFTFLLFFTFFSFSQESRVIDSMKRELKRNPNDISLLVSIGEIYQFSNPTIFKNYLDKANYISLKNSLIKEQANIYLNYGDYYLISGDLNNAHKNYKNSLYISQKYNNKTTEIKSLFSIGQILFFQDKIKESIDTLKIAKKILDKDNNTKDNINDFLNIYGVLGDAYNKIGLYDNSIDILFKAKRLLDKNSLKGQSSIFLSIGNNYKELSQYKSALKYYLEAEKISNKEKDIVNIFPIKLSIMQVYYAMNQNEKAIKIGNSLKRIINVATNEQKGNLQYLFGSILKRQKKYDLALIEFSKSLSNYENPLSIADSNLEIGEIFNTLNNQLKSIKHLKLAYKVYFDLKTNRQLINCCKAIASIEEKNKNYFLSNIYLKKCDSLNKIYLDEEKIKYSIKESIKYETELKEAQIKTQQLQIEKEKTNKYFAFGSIGLLLLISLGGFMWFRNKQQKEKLQTHNTLLTLQQNLNAMQLDNLNKQLDPHEIKNILANISPEIQRNAPNAYNKMTKLLNLTRASLSSNSIIDSIENQIQQIDDYLSLEKTTLSVPLSYFINNTVDTRKQIPRLLLKNLVENAIKHGIKNKKEGGEINISLTENNDAIHISVDDTGIGRQQAISVDTGIGTSTYINLFETLNKKNSQKASFNIIDKENGTKVEIVIPNNYIYF